MAGLLDLTGQNIENTYQRVLQTDGTLIYDGTGSLFTISGNINTGSFVTTSSFNAYTGSNISQFAGTASFAQTASFVQNAVSASYAANGGVTQLLAGPNISLSPTNGLGQVTVSSTPGGGGFNTATGSYGSFYSTQTQTNVASTARSMSLNTTDITNGVSISGSTNPYNTYIKTENAGIYDIQFSAQVDKTDSGTDEIWIWIRKNGTNLSDTATSVQLTGNGAHYVAAWNFFVNAAANDYFQLMWYSPDANVRLHAESAFGIVPGIPSLIVTANRVDQFLSNTGSFSGSFTGNFTGSFLGTATTASYVLNAVSSSFASTSSFLNSTTNAFIQNGNSFGTTALLGTNDSQSLALETSGSTRMFISSSGNVGIGTTTPTALLHISGASSANLLRIGSPASSSIIFVSGSGNVGIGTTTPTGSLHIVDAATSFTIPLQLNSYFRFRGDGVMRWGLLMNQGILSWDTGKVIIGALSGNNLELYANGAARVFVSGSGNVGIGTITPRERLHVAGGNIALDGARHIDFGSGNSRINDLGNIAGQGYPITISTFGPIGTGTANNLTEKLRLTGSGSLGLGTTSPSARFHISGGFTDGNLMRVQSSTGAEYFFISASGNVGIGIASPTAKLDVLGSARITNGLTVTGSLTVNGTATITGTATGYFIPANALGGLSTIGVDYTISDPGLYRFTSMDTGGARFINFPNPASKSYGQTIIIINSDTTYAGYYGTTYSPEDPSGIAITTIAASTADTFVNIDSKWIRTSKRP